MSDEPHLSPEVNSEFRSGDGVRLHTISWPAVETRALLLLSHGLGEHAGRYGALARDLAPHGVTVHALDHRGNGRSGGVRGYTPRFRCFVDDFEHFRQRMTKDVPSDVPVFLLGHSMGGLIAIRWLEAHPEVRLAGAVLSAPLLGIAVKAPRWKVAISGFLSAVLPWLELSNEIDPSELTHDDAYVRSYREDPLVHARITPRLYTEMLRAIGEAFAEKDRISVPLLFLSPGADTVVREEEVLRFAGSLSGDVTVRQYAGFHHESLNEVDRAKPIADIVGWMEERMARQPA